jgi:hypothetical protein
LLLLNSTIVIIIKVDFKVLLKVLKGLKLLLLLLLPNLLLNKLGIIKEILNKTIVMLKNPGNNNNNLGFSLLKSL